ncbi:MAG: hypothetical protein R2867_29780 [Caldilineaceae bacterium]
MFTTSPEGYGVYLANRLDANNPEGGVNGPTIVKSVQLPEEVAARFANLALIGNTEKDTVGTYRSCVWLTTSRPCANGSTWRNSTSPTKFRSMTSLANYQSSLEKQL